MSAMCQNFVQNAWKKELCSNCFKSKDEHIPTSSIKPVPVKAIKAIESIIKGNKKSIAKAKRTVSFTIELAKVIGYGGEDWSDVEQDDDEINIDICEDSDLEDEGSDDKELENLTRANTDFNTIKANLLGETSDIKKSYTHLKLGTPQIDSEGRKQTLLVSVTPFGQEKENNLKKYAKSHIPIAKINKESLIETKTAAVLTSYSLKSDENLEKEEKSLLEEISETLEKGKNPIQIMTRKKIQKDIILTVSKQEVRSITDRNKENIENTKPIIASAIEKNRDKIGKSSIPERKNGITRAPVIKRDQEKPMIFQTSTAKIELVNNKNLKLSESSDSITITKLLKPESRNNNETDEIAQNCEIDNNLMKPLAVVSALEVSHKASEVQLKMENSIPEKNVKKNIPEDVSTDSDISEDSSNEASNSLTESLAAEQESSDMTRIYEEPINKPIVLSKSAFQQSREQAGEPDGRADPEITSEPPPLPPTPPATLETRSSFLHGSAIQHNEKPKVPAKPSTVLIRKPVIVTNHHIETQNLQVLTTFAVEPKASEKVQLHKTDSNGSDIGKTPNKRRAPKPPLLDDSGTVYSRNSTSVNFDSPVVREKEKRERASSCSPKIRNDVSSDPQGMDHYSHPEPAPRRSLSLSTDSLVATGEDKKKEKQKSRFSLKKFLRMSSSKDLQKTHNDVPKIDEIRITDLHPKPRLVIVHPLELNGAGVQVVPKPVICHEHADYARFQNEYSSYCNDHSTYYEHRPAKPPPPPRNLDDWSRASKPNLPHPPKSTELLNRQKQFNKVNNIRKKEDSVYANIGEVRSAITPNKPQRTASMREREELAAQQHKRKISNNYEPINVLGKDSCENVYDYISSARSSSPECDTSIGKSSPTCKGSRLRNVLKQGRSSSHVDVSGECYNKFQSIPRSASLTYCGSETESEIYAPYNFYGSESEVAEDDREWSTSSTGRTYKLRSRKGRSIVHKNLEDNYGAVVVANHEALAQVLENIQQGPPIQPALRGLKTSPNLRWADFSLKENTSSLVIGSRTFHQALWGTQYVTLVITAGSIPTSPLSLGNFSLTPITEFSDLVPVSFFSSNFDKDVKQSQATIAVLPWMQVNSIQTYSELLKSKSNHNTPEEICKDASFVVLELVNALKMLQAQGIEELPLSLTSFVLCKEMDKDVHSRLYVLQGFGEEMAQKKEIKIGSLCTCATTALTHLLPNTKLTPFLRSLLNTERAVSLTQVKSVLEFSLWGPSDVPLSNNIKERELALQRWLDLQRATVLHGLVCTRIQLTVYEECHLLFLVRSNSKMMCDASLLLDSNNMQKMVTNGNK